MTGDSIHKIMYLYYPRYSTASQKWYAMFKVLLTYTIMYLYYRRYSTASQKWYALFKVLSTDTNKSTLFDTGRVRSMVSRIFWRCIELSNFVTTGHYIPLLWAIQSPITWQHKLSPRGYTKFLKKSGTHFQILWANRCHEASLYSGP
jgi:hypothetical protein